jgi:dihydrofolate reductase
VRKVSYNVVSTLDGYIAGPNGEFDWIPHDPAVDFAALYASFDTALLGRKTYDLVRTQGTPPWPKDWAVYVFSTTLRAEEHPDITIVRENAADVVRKLRAQTGRDIWLFGGGDLFASLLAADQVDRIDVTIAPVLLGGGIPLLPHADSRAQLALETTKQYPSGLMTLSYSVLGAR